MNSLPCYLLGEAVESTRRVEVRNPYDGSLVGSVAALSRQQVRDAIQAMARPGDELTRYQR